MAQSEKSKQYVPRITIEDYEKQKREYTRQALLELNQHIQKQDIHKQVHNSHSDNGNELEYEEKYVSNSDYDDDNDDVDKGFKVVINAGCESSGVKDNAGIRRRKPRGGDNTNLAEVMYSQSQKDLLEIKKLQQHIRRLESTLEEEERKNHFLKLDLNNSNIDSANLQDKVTLQKAQISKLENMNYHDYYVIILQKIIICILVIQYVFSLFSS